MLKEKMLAISLLFTTIHAFAGSMGTTTPAYYLYGGVQGGFSASNLSSYRYHNDYFTVKNIESTGVTSSDNALALDLGFAYSLADNLLWRSAGQYIYMPRTSFVTQEYISGYIFAPQAPISSSAYLTTQTNTFFWNNILQREVLQNLSLYIQGGIGASLNQTSASQTYYANLPSTPVIYADGNFRGISSTQFAWNAGVGLWYYVNDNIVLDASYTYASFGRIGTGRGLLNSPVESISASLNRNLFMLGVQYKITGW